MIGTYSTTTIQSLVDNRAITQIQDGNHGASHPKAGEYVPEGIPFLMAGDLQDGAIDFAGCKRLTKARCDRLRIGFAKSGDVLLSHKGSVGRSALVPTIDDYAMLTPQVTYYRVDQAKLDARYLCFAFRSPQFLSQLESVGQQSTRLYISISAQRSLTIPSPPLETQRRIASILGAYDDLIENNTRRIAILEEMARRLYEEWFVHFRFPGHETTTFIDSPLGRIPEGWEVGPIRELYHGLFDGPHATPPMADDGAIFLGIGNLTEEGRLNFAKKRHIAEEHFGEWTRRVEPKAGDIVFTYEATLNRYGLIPEGLRCCLGRRLALIRPLGQWRHFLYQTFFSDRWRNVIGENTLSGSTVDRIPLTHFPNFPVLRPDMGLAQSFNQMAVPTYGEIEKLLAKNANLRIQRDLLLPKLVSGEIDVSEAPQAREIAA